MCKKIRKILGELLVEKREAAGFTQWDLAELGGYLSGQIVSNAERGGPGPPARMLKVMQIFCKLDVGETIELMGEIYKAELKARVKKIKL